MRSHGRHSSKGLNLAHLKPSSTSILGISQIYTKGKDSSTSLWIINLTAVIQSVVCGACDCFAQIL